MKTVREFLNELAENLAPEASQIIKDYLWSLAHNNDDWGEAVLNKPLTYTSFTVTVCHFAMGFAEKRYGQPDAKEMLNEIIESAFQLARMLGFSASSILQIELVSIIMP